MKVINYNKFHKNARLQSRIIKTNNYTYNNVIKTLTSLIINKKNLDILDYGCGVGTISLYLASLGHNIIGIDISNKAIDKANESANILGLKNVHFFTNKKKHLNDLNTKFDLIILIEVIEHIPKDKKIILIISNLLRPNGQLLITTPSIEAPLYKMGLVNNFDKRVGHLRRYDISSINSLFIGSGIKIISISKSESIVRSILYSFPSIGWIVKFVKGPISDLLIYFEPLLIRLFGGSGYYIVGLKL